MLSSQLKDLPKACPNDPGSYDPNSDRSKKGGLALPFEDETRRPLRLTFDIAVVRNAHVAYVSSNLMGIHHVLRAKTTTWIH
ncbi:hypothetical protein AJ78_03134 [Emergomyces pasteurianus Ep9510]|uniref:Uncharacterized protein n=1 Tax=Emergomyces pasteurianus Ep9510 TaxID=1447872 RepID=A0A1J9QN86_9EURO|nr:hypothetical protein AJ78_03134 [Emergomyces pasteurianus Ep9510]